MTSLVNAQGGPGRGKGRGYGRGTETQGGRGAAAPRGPGFGARRHGHDERHDEDHEVFQFLLKKPPKDFAPRHRTP